MPNDAAARAQEIVKSQGGYYASNPWVPDYKPVPKTGK